MFEHYFIMMLNSVWVAVPLLILEKWIVPTNLFTLLIPFQVGQLIETLFYSLILSLLLSLLIEIPCIALFEFWKAAAISRHKLKETIEKEKKL